MTTSKIQVKEKEPHVSAPNTLNTICSKAHIYTLQDSGRLKVLDNNEVK